MNAEPIIERTRALLLREPSVHGVELVGSRRRGTATKLSDIDLLVHTVDFDQLAAALPRVVERAASTIRSTRSS
jgi:predicted nucleotidyltransferase